MYIILITTLLSITPCSPQHPSPRIIQQLVDSQNCVGPSFLFWSKLKNVCKYITLALKYQIIKRGVFFLQHPLLLSITPPLQPSASITQDHPAAGGFTQLGLTKCKDIFSRGTRAQHLTLSVWCVCGVCVRVVSPGWMRCSDRSTRQLYSHNQCVQLYSTCVHTTWAQRGHNIVMNRAGILA